MTEDPPPLQVQTWRLDTRTVLRLIGERDFATSSIVEAALDDLMRADEPAVLIIDLTQIDFIASAGLDLIINARQRLTSNDRHLIVVAPTGSRARRLLDLTHLSDHIPPHETLDAAIEAAHAPGPPTSQT
ncbi:STAS domain-containing protein [Acrocarpospora sp. B8E8]|uniref:STAS domain-containing protein n=1 Tax=Acrocarpospora sp. B8E8 TaxID=3153572 RepID=UPI00325EA03A